MLNTKYGLRAVDEKTYSQKWKEIELSQSKLSRMGKEACDPENNVWQTRKLRVVLTVLMASLIAFSTTAGAEVKGNITEEGREGEKYGDTGKYWNRVEISVQRQLWMHSQ